MTPEQSVSRGQHTPLAVKVLPNYRSSWEGKRIKIKQRDRDLARLPHANTLERKTEGKQTHTLKRGVLILGKTTNPLTRSKNDDPKLVFRNKYLITSQMWLRTTLYGHFNNIFYCLTTENCHSELK